MKSNYKPLGDYIKEVNIRNRDNKVTKLLGVSMEKTFIPSVANITGVDLSVYKILKKNQLACKLMSVGRDEKLPVDLYVDDEDAMVSSAYYVFEPKNNEELLPEFLMMWLCRSENDRYIGFISGGDVRGGISWDTFCSLPIKVPSIHIQKEIVKEYKIIQDRIKLNEQLILKLEKTAQIIFNSYLDINQEIENHRMGDLIEIKGGFSYNSEDLGKGKTYLLGMGCVSFLDRYVEEGMRLYSDKVPEQHLVHPKDIIIATRQQSENLPILGCPAMIPPNLNGKKMVIASNLYKVVNKSILNNEIIYQILKSKLYQEHIKLHTKGTTVGMITKDAIEDYTFKAPSISFLSSVQNNITKVVDNIFLKRTENQKLMELKDLLLSKLATIEK